LPTAFVDYCQHTFAMASKNNDAPEEIEKEIGQTIAMLRRQGHMTQEDLAGKAEIDRSYLSEIENGKKNISIRVLKKIAHALGIKTSTLLDD